MESNGDIRYIDPNELIPWERNPRFHDMDSLRASITRFGFRNIIVVNERTNTIEAGHGRAQAAIDLGITSVPVLFVDDDETTAAAYAIADNRQSELGSWDETSLVPLLLELQKEGDIAYEGTGFSDIDIDALVKQFSGIPGVKQNQYDEWLGMPSYFSEDLTGWKSLLVHFANPADMEAFARLLDQSITPKTKSIWYPPAEVNKITDKRYVVEGDNPG